MDCSEHHGCPVPQDRRSFLRDTFLSVAGALVAVGASKSDALAMPLEFISARSRSGSTRSYAVPTADGAQIDRDSAIILVRWQGFAYAFELSCPHQNTALHWEDGDHIFQCPKHHSKYKPDGTFIEGRATRGMDRHPIKRDGQNLVVDVETVFEEDSDSASWHAAQVKLA